MALGVTDLKKGRLIEIDETPYKVIEYSQKVVGRGGSIVSVKIKSLIDGRVLDKTFKGNDSVEAADVATRNVQYLYKDDARHYFMDQDTYEQHEVPNDIISDKSGFLKEGDSVQASVYNGTVIAIDMAKNVPLKVTYTEDVVKGDTSSSVQKDATLETGIVVKVPAFIKNDDIVSVDTETGAYRARVSA